MDVKDFSHCDSIAQRLSDRLDGIQASEARHIVVHDISELRFELLNAMIMLLGRKEAELSDRYDEIFERATKIMDPPKQEIHVVSKGRFVQSRPPKRRHQHRSSGRIPRGRSR